MCKPKFVSRTTAILGGFLTHAREGFIDLGQFIGAEDDGGDDEDNADFDGGVEIEKLLTCFCFHPRVEPPSVADAANRYRNPYAGTMVVCKHENDEICGKCAKNG